MYRSVQQLSTVVCRDFVKLKLQISVSVESHTVDTIAGYRLLDISVPLLVPTYISQEQEPISE